MTDKLYFIVRTDVSETSGQQRVLGAYNTESDAASWMAHYADEHPGQFAVYKGTPAGGYIRDRAPGQYVPVSSS